MRRSLVLLLALALSSCVSPADDIQIGTSSCPSCKVRVDAGSPGRSDAGSTDAGALDGGPDGGGDAGLDGGAAFDAGPDAGPSDAGPDGGLPSVCPAGSINFGGQTLDLCQSLDLGAAVPLDGVQISTLEPYGSTVSSDGGQYVLCVPPNQPTTIQYSIPGYVTSYLGEFVLAAALPGLTYGLGLTSMLCTADQEQYLQQVPAYDKNLGAAYTAVLSASGMLPCGGTTGGLADWTFTATLVDGGVGDGGPWPAAYFDAAGDLESAGSTFDNGKALVFDIDPAVQYVVVQGTNSRVGSACPTLDAAVGFTGRLYVAPDTISFYPWIVD